MSSGKGVGNAMVGTLGFGGGGGRCPLLHLKPLQHGVISQGADPPPPFNRWQVEIIWMSKILPSYPHEIGEQYGQTISKLCQAALLHRCELPLETKMGELTHRSLYLIHYSEGKTAFELLKKIVVRYIHL